MNTLLGYIPFLDPISRLSVQLHDVTYLLLIPMSFMIAMIYKAIRMPELNHYWRNVGILTAQILLGVIGLALALVFLVQVIIPALPAE